MVIGRAIATKSINGHVCWLSLKHCGHRHHEAVVRKFFFFGQWYGQGGVLLVKNMETAFKEVEGQEAQAMAQLDQQIPKNHPMRKQAEAQAPPYCL